MEQARRQPERADFMLLNHFAQLGQRRRARRKNHEPPPVQQRPPDFQRRGIKRHRRKLEKHLAGIEAGEIGSLNQSHHAAMRHTNALGPPGGTGREADVGQVVRCCSFRRGGSTEAGDGFPVGVQADHRRQARGRAGVKSLDQLVRGPARLLLRQEERCSRLLQ